LLDLPLGGLLVVALLVAAHHRSRGPPPRALEHQHLAALRAQPAGRTVPGRKRARGITRAPVEHPAFPGPALDDLPAVERTPHADADRPGVRASRIPGAGDELAVTPAALDKGLAAARTRLADLLGGDLHLFD